MFFLKKGIGHAKISPVNFVKTIIKFIFKFFSNIAKHLCYSMCEAEVYER